MEVDGTNAIETVQQEEANSPREIKQHKETDDADQKEPDPDEHLVAPELDHLLADHKMEGGGTNVNETVQFR